MTEAPSRDEIAARLEAIEARTDAKFAEIMGELRTDLAAMKGEMGIVSAKIDAIKESTHGTKATVIGTGVAAIAIVVAILSYGQSWFGLGMGARDTVRAVVSDILRNQVNNPPASGSH